MAVKVSNYNLWMPLLVMAGVQVQAQQINREALETPLEEVLVTAARADDDWQTLPYALDLLDAEALRQRPPRNLPEALFEMPGLMAQKTANGQGSPFIRGFTGYRTLALIDGVRYNNSVYRDGPSEYFSLIDSASLSQIELLRGPASTLYGSDAIGGAINLQTRRADYLGRTAGGYSAGRVWSRYASAERSLIGRAELELGEGDRWGLLAGVSAKDFGDVKAADLGVQPKTGYDERAWDVRLDYSLNDNWTLSYLHQSLAQDDVWRTHSTIYARSFAGTEVGTDLRRLKDQQRQLDYLKFAGDDISRWLDSAQLTISRQHWCEEGDRVKAGGKRIEDWFDSTMWGVDLQLQSEFDGGQLVYGVDYYLDRVDSGRTDSKPDGSREVRIQGPVGDDSEFAQGGVYLRADFDLNARSHLNIGTRYNRVEARVGRYQDPATELVASYRDTWSSWVLSARASFDLSEQWLLWGGVSQSFRAPNIADVSRYGGSRSNELEVAAAGLVPERFLTYELGLKRAAADLTAEASIFYTDMQDYIASTPTGRVIDGQTEVSKQNAASGYIEGVELALDYALGYAAGGDWSVFANYTYLRGELTSVVDSASGIPVTEPYSRIMPATFHGGVRWQVRDYWLRLTLTHAVKADKLSSADKADTQRIPPGGTPAYTLVNLEGGWQLSDQLQLSAALKNLTDEPWRSHGSGSNEPGRGVELGLRFEW